MTHGDYRVVGGTDNGIHAREGCNLCRPTNCCAKSLHRTTGHEVTNRPHAIVFFYAEGKNQRNAVAGDATLLDSFCGVLRGLAFQDA